MTIAPPSNVSPHAPTSRPRLVVMNAEGTTPVSADVAVGAEVPALRTLGWTLVATGLVVISGSAIGLTMGLRRGP